MLTKRHSHELERSKSRSPKRHHSATSSGDNLSLHQAVRFDISPGFTVVTITLTTPDPKTVTASWEHNHASNSDVVIADTSDVVIADIRKQRPKTAIEKDEEIFRGVRGEGAHYCGELRYENRWENVRPGYELTRGDKLMIRGDYEGAIEAYGNEIAEAPKIRLHYNRGLCKVALKDYAGAVVDFTEALKNNRDDMAAFINRGASKAAMGDHHGAIKDYQLVFAIIDNKYHYSGKIYYNCAVSHAALGDHETAIKYYRDAISRDYSNYREAHANLGISMAALKRYGEAIREYDTALRYGSGTSKKQADLLADAHSHAADSWVAKGYYKWAVQGYARAIAIDPNLVSTLLDKLENAQTLHAEQKNKETAASSRPSYGLHSGRVSPKPTSTNVVSAQR